MKKLLPVFTVVVLLLSLSLAFVGCSAEDKIVGTWGEGNRYQYTFNKDGTWTSTCYPADICKWTYDKKTKTYKIDWSAAIVWTATINKDGDLVMNDLVYKRVKE